MSTISIVRGDSKSLLVRVEQADGTPVTDLEQYTFRLTIDGPGGLHEANVRIVEDGVQFTLTPTYTETLVPRAQYAYDIEMANLDRSMVRTLVIGSLAVTADVGGPPA